MPRMLFLVEKMTAAKRMKLCAARANEVVAEVDGGCESVKQLQDQTAEATEKIPVPDELVTPEVKRYIASTPEDLEVESAHGFVRFSEATFAAQNPQPQTIPPI